MDFLQHKIQQQTQQRWNTGKYMYHWFLDTSWGLIKFLSNKYLIISWAILFTWICWWGFPFYSEICLTSQRREVTLRTQLRDAHNTWKKKKIRNSHSSSFLLFSTDPHYFFSVFIWMPRKLNRVSDRKRLQFLYYANNDVSNDKLITLTGVFMSKS